MLGSLRRGLVSTVLVGLFRGEVTGVKVGRTCWRVVGGKSTVSWKEELVGGKKENPELSSTRIGM